MKPPLTKGSDDFQTPGIALKPLIPYLSKHWLIWECAEGKGNLTKALKEKGFHVIGTDLIEGFDFLKGQLPEFDCIVTNPPYKLRYQFIKRCYSLGKPWAMLMTLTTLEGKRQPLFEKYGIQLLLLNKRINFECPSGRGSGAWFPVAWFCWKLLPSQLFFGKI